MVERKGGNMLSKIFQLASKLESVEGTAETLAAADAKVLFHNPVCKPNPKFFDRNPEAYSFTKLGKLVGSRPVDLSGSIRIKGSGTATTDPQWIKLLKACSLGPYTLYSIPIGAITSGPFQHGEYITGSISLATGRVIKKTATGTTPIYFIASTGTFQSGEVLTGGTSGATATTSSTPSTVGRVLLPRSFYTSGGIESLTLGSYEDTYKKILKGARGNASFNFKTGEPGIINLNYSGVESSLATGQLFTGVTPETAIPPVWLSAVYKLDTYAAKVREFNFDLNNVLSPRDDANEAKGILSFKVTDRNPTGSFKVEKVNVATHDFYGKMNAGTEVEVDFFLGSTTGHKFEFYFPKLQYLDITEEDAEGITLFNVPFCLNGTAYPGEDELAILAL
jgi:hypothetical protein